MLGGGRWWYLTPGLGSLTECKLQPVPTSHRLLLPNVYMDELRTVDMFPNWSQS